MFEETQDANCDCTDEEPLVEILMATYNGAQYVGEQIDSILNQTYSHWRLLVNDDGSSDGTVGIVKAYAEKDERIQLLSLENKRHDAAGNFLALLAVSSAPYVMFCDQDDVWRSNKVEMELRAVQLLEKEDGRDVPALVFTDSRIVDEELRPLGSSFASMMAFDAKVVGLAQLMVDNVAQGCTMMLNAALVREALSAPFDPLFLMHDYWAIVLAAACGKIRFLSDMTLEYRQHGNNVYGANCIERTTLDGLLHVLRNPSVLRGWLRKLSHEEKKFQGRARALLAVCKDDMSSDAERIVTELSNFDSFDLMKRCFLIKKYGLLRTQRNRYLRTCQRLGLLLP